MPPSVSGWSRLRSIAHSALVVNDMVQFHRSWNASYFARAPCA